MENKRPHVFSPPVEGLFQLLHEDSEVREFIELADAAMEAIGYTEHGFRHVSQVSDSAGRILTELGHSEEQVQLARCAGFLHDIGNLVGRQDHTRSGAMLAYPILRRLGFTPYQAGIVMGAIGSHEEEDAPPLNPVCAAVIIADKADVHRSRVRSHYPAVHDIHDDVNYACMESQIAIDRENSLITLELKIDPDIASVMEYFQIFTRRMMMTRDSVRYLGCEFRLVVNGTVLA